MQIKQKTVLVVDDSPELLRATARAIGDAAYVTVRAGSMREALKKIEDGLRFDILVSDHDMFAGEHGSDLIRKLREMGFEQPMFLYTGSSAEDFDCAHNGIFRKPRDLKLLLAEIARQS